MVETLQQTLARLNALLAEGEITPYRLGIAAPEDLKPAPKNAHFMTQDMFSRLTENVRRDGNLSSLPFCWADGGTFYILSGHHRVDSARAAGVKMVLFLYTDAALSQAERVAIQLSHNAIVGQDNLAILKELYEEIDRLDMMEYTGLDDRAVGRFDEIVPPSFQDVGLDFEEVSMLFLPTEFDRMQEVLARLGEYRGVEVFVAGREDWDRFWETLLRFKEGQNILNTATAIAAMVEITAAWLDAQESAQEAQGDPVAEPAGG